jgi:hypothetical protein
LVLIMLAEIDWKLLPIVALAAGLIAYHFYPQLSHTAKRLLGGALILGTVVFSALLGVRIVQNVEAPPLWDYSAFWLNGQVAARGLDFYDAASFQQVAAEVGLGADLEFKREIIDVGFWYPTPTMWFFLPLGFTNLNTSMLIWYMLQSGAAVGVIFLLWRMLQAGDSSAPRWLSVSLSILCLVGLQSTRSNIGMGQSMFMLMLFFALFWQERGHWRGGVWLALAAVVKPFLIIIVLYLLLRRRWAALTGAAIAGVVITLFTVVGFGLEQTLAYLFANPTKHMPVGIYTEWTNQSLLAGVLRFVGFTPEMGTGLTHPLFLVVAAMLTLLTIGPILRLKNLADEVILSLVTLLAVLLYPVSQDMYSMVLLMPLLVIWRLRASLPGSIWTVVGIMVVINYLVVTQALLATLALWLVFVWIAIGAPVPNLLRVRKPHLRPIQVKL